MNDRKRKSVIVSQKRPCTIDKLDEEINKKCVKAFQEVNPEKVDISLVQVNYFEKVKLDLDIPAFNTMVTHYLVQEEKTHLEMIKIIFTKTWYEISFGERIMTDYTKFCQTKREFTPEYFDITSRQIR